MKESKIPETNVNGPFKDDFVKWIESNGYSKYDFSSFVLGPQASYGGKESPNQSINKRPIVFIHGNSDGALAEGVDEWAQGWSATIEHLHRRGYSAAELYAITYGDRNLNNSLTRSMNCSILLRLRHFVEAVLLYTGAEKIDIIAHSMGVTLARKVIQGTMALGEGGDDSCHLGTSIRHRVHTLIGIAGANYGLCLCADSAPELVRNSPACNRETGFWAAQSKCPRPPDQEEEKEQNECAGTTPALQTAQCNGSGQYAAVLQTLNTPDKGKDAHFVVSMWSRGDALLGPSNLVWGHHTSLIPHSDNSTVYASHSHHSIKWMTLEDQAAFVGA
uniref:Triacylglycerol lipase n=1 Tax=Globodera rostochiensis TaxID=31243 RepID=A0A914I6R6_GLORO